MQTDILFLSPGYSQVFKKINVKNINYERPPTSLIYLSNYLKGKNFKTKIIDLQFIDYNSSEFEKEILKSKPKYVGISVTSPIVSQAIAISKLIKKKFPEIKIIWGGVHPSVFPNKCAKNEFLDIICFGEAEETLCELLSNKDLSEIKGISYLQDGKVKVNPKRIEFQKLDEIPLLDLDELPVENYGVPYIGRTFGVISSRGCIYNCSFCAVHAVSKAGVRKRNPKKFVDELKHLKQKYGLNNFILWDDCFNHNKKHVKDICNEIINQKLKIKWSCQATINGINVELLDLMKKSGCELIHYGIESGNQEILNNIRKGTNLIQIKKIIKETSEKGIKTYGFFLLGLPFETKDTINDTIRFAKELSLDYATFNIVIPFPGSQIYELAKKSEGITFVGKTENFLPCYGESVVETPYLKKDELEKLQKRALREFYFRPSYIAKRILTITPSQILRDIQVFFELVKMTMK